MAEAPPPSKPSEDRGPAIQGFLIGFTAAAGVFVALRLSIRVSRKLLGWDDAAICVAMIACILEAVFGSMSAHYGYGKHLGDIPVEDLSKTFFWFYITQICYKVVTWPTKISILLMYSRVFGDTPDVKAYGITFRVLLRVVMAIVVSMFITTSVVGIFQCTPVRYSWDKSIDGHCIEVVPWWFTYSSFNISTDVLILALPIPLINGLMQITRRQKTVLMGVFLLGAFVCVVTIVRMTTLKTGARGNDPSYTGAITLKWTAVETGIGIICACLPLLRPILNRLIPWFAQRTLRATSARPTYNMHGYGGTAGTNFSNKNHNNNNHSAHSWDYWGAGQNVVMNNISSRRPESVNSSEAGITDGITRKVDFSTSVEMNDDADSDKEKQIGRAVSHDNLV